VSVNGHPSREARGSNVRRLVARLARVTPVLALSACSWFTDFKQQPKIDPWESPNDTIPPRGNPQFSVPVYGSVAPGLTYDRAPTPQAVSSMAGLANPVAADSASVNRGRIQYQINCAVCHGPSGMGNGNATKYGFPAIGIGAGSNAANTLSDGYIFGMIRNGRGLMPSYNRIEENDRWDVVNYLRSIQGKGTIAADTTHGRPGETGRYVPGPSLTAPTRPAPFVKPTLGAGSAAERPAEPGAAVRIDSTRKTPPDTTRKPEHTP
jgi:mono/diheme cytochrome c family protein